MKFAVISKDLLAEFLLWLSSILVTTLDHWTFFLIYFYAKLSPANSKTVFV